LLAELRAQAGAASDPVRDYLASDARAARSTTRTLA
jgi:L-rhamnose isomerase